MNNTTCEDFRGLLDRLLDGEITPEEQARLDAHAATCPDCAALREALPADRDALADALDDVPPMPKGTHDAWMAAIRAEKANAQAAGRRKWLRWAGAAAAALYLVGGTYLARDRLRLITEPPKPLPAARATHAAPAAEEAEDLTPAPVFTQAPAVMATGLPPQDAGLLTGAAASRTPEPAQKAEAYAMEEPVYAFEEAAEFALADMALSDMEEAAAYDMEEAAEREEEPAVAAAGAGFFAAEEAPAEEALSEAAQTGLPLYSMTSAQPPAADTDPDALAPTEGAPSAEAETVLPEPTPSGTAEAAGEATPIAGASSEAGREPEPGKSFLRYLPLFAALNLPLAGLIALIVWLVRRKRRGKA